MKQRIDDYEKRSKHLNQMDDVALKSYFYKLIDEMIDPMLELSYAYTTPAIERSVLMRMGFSSVEAKAITDLCFEHQLLTHGAGHMVFKYAKAQNLSIRDAGMKLLETDAIKIMVEVFKDA